MKTSTNVILLTLAIVIALLVQCVNGGDTNSSRYRPSQSREEEDEIRYKRPFAYIVVSLGLSIAPVIGRFLVCLITDPIIPILFRELKNWAKKCMLKCFSLTRGDSSNKRVDVANKTQEVDAVTEKVD